MATDRRPQMRLMAHDLLGADLALLAAFLRVGRDQLVASWALVFDGEADVVLFGRVNARTVPGLLDLPKAVAQVVDAGPRRPGFLSRPLDYGSVLELLKQAERTAGITTGPASAPSAPVEPLGTLFRLRRWPSPSLLQARPDIVRIAGFLSTRPIDLRQLGELSGQSLRRCKDLLAVLGEAGLLEQLASRGSATAGESTAAPAAPPARQRFV